MRSNVIAIIFCIVAACSCASSQPLPAVADDLPSDVRLALRVFDHRVKAAYPVDIGEAGIIAKLREDGFVIGSKGIDGYRTAEINRGNGICRTIWSVRWKAETDNVTELFGVYGHQCP